VEDIIRKRIQEGIETKRKFVEDHIMVIIQAVGAICEAIEAGKKILLFGNGGSAADAQHLAAEFVNRFLIERPPLPAIALTTDSSILTSISNDDAFSEIFRKQIKALAKEGDIAWGISTSGRSQNVFNGLLEAKQRRLITIGMTGMDGGKIAPVVDFSFHVNSSNVPNIQEVHITAGHLICELVDYRIFKGLSD
jgi:D-sedoheptulose 7-phosphate isomerase